MKLKDTVIITEVAGSQVLVEVDDGSGNTFHGVVRLNETAAFMVNQLKKGCTLDELKAALTAEYDGDPEKMAADAADLVGKLKDIGLIIE